MIRIMFAFLLKPLANCAILCLAATLLQSLPSASADPVLVTQKRLAELDTFAQSQVQSGQFGNMAYGLWQGDTLLQSGFHGPITDVETQTVSEDTIYQIYSMTKPVTAVGMMILHERGYFDLDDPITAVLPEFENIKVAADYDENDRLFTYRPPNPPTFRQLLSHTAGLACQSADRSAVDRRYIEMHIADSPSGDELVARVSSIPLMRTPGSEWHYSIASDLQGVIIERLTGETLHDFLKREVFDPLGMQDTGFFVDNYKAARVSAVTSQGASGLVSEPATDLSQAHQSLTYFEGGHGLMSTMKDYRQFLKMLLHDGCAGDTQILQPESIAVLTTNAIRYKGQPAPQRGYGTQAGLGYGFGVSIVENPEVAGMSAPTGTYYWYGALGSWFWVDPVNGISFIGMIQTREPVAPDMIAATMAHVYGAETQPAQLAVSP